MPDYKVLVKNAELRVEPKRFSKPEKAFAMNGAGSNKYHAVATLGLVGLLFVPATEGASEQVKELTIAKGDSVVLVVPTSLTARKWTGLMGTNLKVDVEARWADGEIEIADPDSSVWRRDWRSVGFPMVGKLLLTNIKTVTREKAKFFEVTLRRASGIGDFRVFAPVEQPQVLAGVLGKGSAGDSLISLGYEALGAKFFAGPLATFTADERQLLLTFAHVTANGTTIGHEAYKGLTYLEIALPGDGSTWNDLRVSRTERIGRVISEQLGILKAFAKIAVPHEAIGGVKLSQPSRHGTAPNYNDVTTDLILAYFPLDALLKFANADITSQQLVDASIVLINGDRIQVDLSKQ